MKRLFGLTLLAVLSVATGYLLYDGYTRYRAFKVTIEENARHAAEVAKNRERISVALSARNIGLHEITRGFWYTYDDSNGGKSVEFFDLAQWASRTELTNVDIQTLAAWVANAERVDREAMKVVSEDLPQSSSSIIASIILACGQLCKSRTCSERVPNNYRNCRRTLGA